MSKSGLPKLHPRERIVAEAKVGIAREVFKHELTYGERLAILSELLSTAAKYQIRLERHGNTDTPGGIE